MANPRTGFRKYFEDTPFVDRLLADSGLCVDVIIPVLHTNELWQANLFSIYREIPVKRLLLGDGGCIDDTIAIARKFPRVEVFDHRAFKSLGFSIRRLIEEVQTEWFIYLHSDVYLPEGWFNEMAAARNKYDWFESGQNVTVMVEYMPPTLEVERAYSGSQMGRKAAFKDVLPKIDDDYLYRNEDIIFANLIKDAGFRYGKVAEASHDHQVMFKESRWLRRVKRAAFELELSIEEEVRASRTYVYGIIKYLHPDRSTDLIPGLRDNLYRLEQLKEIDANEFAHWVARTNPAWSDVFPIASKGGTQTITSQRELAEAAQAQAPAAAATAGVPSAHALASAGSVSVDHVETVAEHSHPPGRGRMPTVAARTAPPAAQEPLAYYQPTPIGRAAIYVLGGTDLLLRGRIGPGRYLLRRGQADGTAPALHVVESRPTQLAMKLVKYLDQVACGRRSLRQVGADVKERLSVAFSRWRRR